MRRTSFATNASNQGMMTFLPRSLLHTAAQRDLPDRHYVERFQGDISGFTAMAEELSALGPSGFERLCRHLNQYFDALITIVDYFGGDVIKIAGDALLILWRVDGPQNHSHNHNHNYSRPGMLGTQASGSGFSQDLIDLEMDVGSVAARPGAGNGAFNSAHYTNASLPVAVYRASACAMRLMKAHERFGVPNGNSNGGTNSGFTGLHPDMALPHVSGEDAHTANLNLRLHCSLTAGDIFGVHCMLISRLLNVSVSGDILMDKLTAQCLKQFLDAECTHTATFQDVPGNYDIVRLVSMLETPKPRSVKKRFSVFKANSDKVEPLFNSLSFSPSQIMGDPDKFITRNIYQEWYGTCMFPLAVFDKLTRYIPTMVQKRVYTDNFEFIAEIRKCCVIFISFGIPNITSEADCARINDAFEIIQTATEKSEGYLRQFLMDDKGFVAIIIYGLSGMSHEDDSSRAVTTSLKISESLNTMGVICSIGCTSGKAFCGIIGGSSRREFAVVGDIVNMAARFMGLSRGVICDENLYMANKHQIKFEILPPVKIKGREALQNIYQASIMEKNTDENQTDAPSGLRVSRLLKRSSILDRADKVELVGRQNETTLISSLVTDFKQHFRAQVKLPGTKYKKVLVVTGDAGLGKSALMSYMKSSALKLGFSFFGGTSSPLDGTTPYYIWRDIFRKTLGLDKAQDQQHRLSIVEDMLLSESANEEEQESFVQMDSRPKNTQLLSLLNDILDIKAGVSASVQRLPAAQRAQTTRDLLLHLLNLERHTYPRVIILEDVQWMDSASWQFLIYAAQYSNNTLFALTTRPMTLDEITQEVTQFSALEASTVTINLNPINREECIQLACSILKVDKLPISLSNAFFDKTQGNPCFVEEICLTLIEKGAIITEENRAKFSPTFDLESVKLPETIEDMIIQRIDALDFDAMNALKTASVLGQSFLLEDLEFIYPNPARKTLLSRFLETCKKHKLLIQSTSFTTQYSFPSTTIRDIAYNMLLGSQRQILHQQVAKYFEEKYQTSLSRYYPFLAYHYSRASNREMALHYYNLSANQAIMTRCNQEVIKYLMEVYKIAESEGIQFNDNQRSRWDYLLGEAYFNNGQGQLAMRHYTNCLSLCQIHFPESKWAIDYLISKKTFGASVDLLINKVTDTIRCRNIDVVPTDDGLIPEAGKILRDGSVPLFRRLDGVNRNDSQPNIAAGGSLRHQTSSTITQLEDSFDNRNSVIVCLSRLSHLYMLEGNQKQMALCCYMINSIANEHRNEVDSIQSLGNMSLLYSVSKKQQLARKHIDLLRRTIATQNIFGGICIRAAVALLSASMSLLSMNEVENSIRHCSAGLSYSVLVNDPRTQMEFHMYTSYITFLTSDMKQYEEMCVKIQKIAKSKSDVQLFCAHSILQGLLFARCPKDSSVEILSSLEDSMIYIESLGENAIRTDRVMLKSIYALIHHRVDILYETVPLIMECATLHIFMVPGIISCLNVALRQIHGGVVQLKTDRNLSIVEQMMDERKSKPRKPALPAEQPEEGKAMLWDIVNRLHSKLKDYARHYPILEPCVQRYAAYIYLEKKMIGKCERHLLEAYRKAEAMSQKMEMCMSSLELFRQSRKVRGQGLAKTIRPWDEILHETGLAEFIPAIERKVFPY